MRLIDKLPPAPNFDDKIIYMISNFLFLEDKPFNYGEQCKTFLLGTQKYREYNPKYALQIMGNIAFLKDMFRKEKWLNIENFPFLPEMIITGGINPEYKNDTEETKFVKKLYTEGGKYDWRDVLTIPQSIIIYMRYPWHFNYSPRLEMRSVNTKENFMAVKEKGWYENVEHLRLITTAESSLRVLATAKKHLPNLQDVATLSYTPTFPELGIKCDKENWAKHPLSQRYVYGELLRVIKYDEMGEIKLSDQAKVKLHDIVVELQSKQY